MKFTRPILTALLGLSLAACSDGDTVIALNVSYGDGLSEVETLRVVLEQGSNSHEEVFDAPRVGGELDMEYFRRITLSDSWGGGEATVEVWARDDANAVITSDSTTVRVREGGAVAAFVELGIEMEPPPEDSGAPDAAVEDSGTAIDSGSPEDSGMPVDSGDTMDGASPDGAVPDAALTDGAVGDGAVGDGAVLLPDGAVVLEDGAVVADSAVVDDSGAL